jgi:acyl dehydratase
MATAAFLGMRQWQFARPIYFGDTVHVLTEVIQKHAHNRRRGEVVWRRQLINQHGQVVQTGEFQTLVEVAKVSPLPVAPLVAAPLPQEAMSRK